MVHIYQPMHLEVFDSSIVTFEYHNGLGYHLAGKLPFSLNSNGKISSCNMFKYLLALGFPLMKIGPMILSLQFPAQTITLPAPCIFVGHIQ